MCFKKQALDLKAEDLTVTILWKRLCIICKVYGIELSIHKAPQSQCPTGVFTLELEKRNVLKRYFDGKSVGVNH